MLKKNRQILKSIITISALFIGSTVYALEPFRAIYLVDYNGKQLGTATSTLKNINNEWNYSFTATSSEFIHASAQSKFTQNNTSIQSEFFNRNTKLFFFNTQNSITFDVSKKMIFTQDNKASYAYPLEKNVLDELNIELQIREDLKNQQLKNEYLVAGMKKTKMLQITPEGLENITTPIGTYETLKISMTHDDSNRQTTFWLAPVLNYLPVKALHIDKNFSYSILLNEYQNSKK
ncbi:hypothetical protein B9T31_16225 [Acinetobacter sp. ANC 4558]|uniref:DUF3108 domain-containing protein n=1 Tax=Acinetobacter sp. ANC 4558 TaxID=1977876 RepID=UPI000A3385A8|nr:DUF3108 domain-containing protein [Acinetobacter sp. ANC 4558]OTG80432.1 hypothetical protein B9T31_16225 [Acinetobacter sp. ANC 4558]